MPFLDYMLTLLLTGSSVTAFPIGRTVFDFKLTENASCKFTFS